MSGKRAMRNPTSLVKKMKAFNIWKLNINPTLVKKFRNKV